MPSKTFIKDHGLRSVPPREEGVVVASFFPEYHECYIPHLNPLTEGLHSHLYDNPMEAQILFRNRFLCSS